MIKTKTPVRFLKPDRCFYLVVEEVTEFIEVLSKPHSSYLS